jgi:hypothetical protein
VDLPLNRKSIMIREEKKRIDKDRGGYKKKLVTVRVHGLTRKIWQCNQSKLPYKGYR